MKLIIRVAMILMLVSMSGCSKEDKSAKAADTDVLKTQLETLKQAKQVEQVVQDAEAQQRKKIAEETQ